ncbi:lovastatin nonaketide synthase [Aspergillus sclerotiicarbonarius CBS 121057]|uniref:Lovastatin nonaketide synthase n=1 Tax=Aspergillus sclerotiicarbonarius (strain CBS 121057 / IBT 28362) TaxID=1448318 RepID=A0A319DSU4_ASPSB|nr:lovastatin nonaketide synthase [Aspergillus sclerotiicarbonarius CBS 121057]
MSTQHSEPIAIVGSGCRFPGGASSPSALWKLLEKPRDACLEIPKDRFDTTGFYHPDGSHHGTTNVQHAYLLQEDLKVFDTAFFNISPNEADSIDPQQRLLMETVYEALESGGHTLDDLRGSDTAVYVGTMGVDYLDTLLRDVNTTPTYLATGTNRAIISNRVSYFFDWHGPSMTIDTACSSSLVAVHQGVQALRSGESRVAVACGTQVILGPELFIFESKMKMLSPTGRSRMWDADADGYARGEGVAAIVLKRLSDAIADGDHIECLIRGTGANQDGFSNGITVPSTDAQAALIRQTYARAGLDPANPLDRPQFFEAHGTGTKAGDPKEAAAIHQIFGQRGDDEAPLYVGSAKTVIGHTEGAAGLAGLLKASGIIQKAFIPPNLLFNRLNPSIEPFYNGLKVPTTQLPWPELPEGVPRRVSVNSFGFGGSNAHAILEEYKPEEVKPTSAIEAQSAPFTPFVFSAVSDSSLADQLQAYSDYLKKNPDVDASDLAYTLQSRRSRLPVKAAFSAATTEQLTTKIDEKLADLKRTPGTSVGIRSNKQATPHILGVFTGQGAQWAAMGAQLIRSSEYVRMRVQDLQESLATLPSTDRPQWDLREEMLAGAETSRIAEAALSQPLCTAIQILLVDLLKTAGITFNAVVGHSSGEIGAAYAAGFFSAHDAIRIAYYRGIYARLAGNSSTGQKGSMMAVGTSLEDAQDLIQLGTFRGRLAVAAHNSSASVTISGDADAVILAKKVFDEEKKFARLLKVDTAYHSPHMLPCGDPYVHSLQSCGVRVNQKPSTTCAWFSSVNPSERPMEPEDNLQAMYWRDNMTNSVLFCDAVKNAVASDPQLSLAIEVGPHPALKGPAVQNISDVRPTPLPYTGLLSRGKDDVQALSDALGFIWTHIGGSGVDLQSFETAASGRTLQPKLVVGLPSYCWNHSRTHWYESRRSRKMLGRKQPFHEILGVLSPDSTPRDMRWTNVLKVSEIPWLDGHQLQSQTVFPAAGYVAMAFEATKIIASNRPVRFLELNNLNIPRAITFEEDANTGVETLVTLTAISSDNAATTADFSCYSSPASAVDQEMELTASGSVRIVFGTSDVATLFSTPVDEYNMTTIDADTFYTTLGNLGYGYYGTFRGMSSLKRRLNNSSVMVETYAYTDADSSTYLVHPTMLDVAFQASMLAYSAPEDERLWSLHVPTSIRNIRVNPELCSSLPTSGSHVPVCASLDDSESFRASIDIFAQDGKNAMIQVEDLTIKPFAPATEADDRRLFSHLKYDVASPDGASVVDGIRPSAKESELATVCERISYYYVRKWRSEISEEDWANGQEHHLMLRDYVHHTFDTASNGRHPCVKKAWSEDTKEEIEELVNRFSDNVDVRLIAAVGENIPAAVRGETTILEHMLPDNMLDEFYKQGLGFQRYNSFLAGMMKQMIHRYPHARILEIGAGTGGATKSVLESIGTSFSSYTYTDVSVGFFQQASELFKAYRNQMIFQVLDIEKSPSDQGYEPHSYDIIIASNVLHATASLQRTLEHTRQLLKPGGYLMLLEITNNGSIRFSNIMGGLPGWWLGVADGRKYAPTITTGQWHSVLRNTGFGGVDAITPEIDRLSWPLSIMMSQAVDDRVNFLRRPLLKASSSAKMHIESLVIMGTESLESARIAEELEDHLGPFCDHITILDSLPSEDDAISVPPMSVFINLVDIVSPIFKDMTAERMEGLKRLYELARHILWITVGAQGEEPYHTASISFSRAMSHEAGHICLNHLDMSDLNQNVSRVIAEELLRQSALDEWQSSPSQNHKRLLWSKEPETFYNRGQFMLPRLISNSDQNARNNSVRRGITRAVRTSSSNIAILPSLNLTFSLVEQVLPLPAEENKSLVRVESSSLMALRVAPDTFLFLGTGKDSATGENVVALSSSNSNEMVPLASVPVQFNRSAGQLLVAVASELLSASLIETIPQGSSIVIHCDKCDRFLVAAISRRAATKGIRLRITTDSDNGDDAREPGWLNLSARMPRQALRQLLHAARATHYLDLTEGISELSHSITAVLSAGHKKVELTELTRDESLLSCDAQTLTSRLEHSLASVPTTSDAQVQDLVVHINQIQGHPRPSSSSVVNWETSDTVTVEVRPLDARRLFSPDKTYILFGLSGQIGQSVCDWMVSNGAGCVCLTSRNPNIDKAWLKTFEERNATVKIYSMDMTDKAALERVVSDVRATCPPIAGVANGAMVLKDTLLSNMSVETMQVVLGPKIDGSRNLDEVFYNEPLDFFILFSSSACVIGNSGQSNYAAANGYLNGLAKQRRKRGLAASTLDIGRIAGIGYIETAGQAVLQQLTRFGLMAINEPEMHQMFAETVLAGYPSPEDKAGIPDAVVTTGIRTIRDDEDILGPWFDNPLFSHCIIESKDTQEATENQVKKVSLPVAEQLTGASTMEQALDIVKDCFTAKLRVILQVSDESIHHDTPLVELGLDSLVAVEVRSWFLKELKVDIPVLKVVGGASVTELCEQALKKLPEDMLSAIGETKATPEPVAAPSPKSAEPQVAVPSTASNSNSTPASIDSDDEGNLTPPSSAQLSLASSSENLRELAAPQNVAKTSRKFLKSEPVSFGQSRFWFLRLLLDDPRTSNVAFYYHITGNLRIGDMERAIRLVTARHEALRTCFVADETQADRAYQHVMSSSPLRLERKEIQSVDDVATEYAKLQEHTFDLESGDLIRLVLLSLSPTSHYLLVNYHHILMDGVSFQVLLSDLEKAYKGETMGAPSQQFPAFSADQREAFETGEMNEDLEYWQTVFPKGEQPPVLPLLPMARTSSRIAMKNFAVHQVRIRLEPALAARIKSAAKTQRSTPFHFYLAAFKAMLFSFTDVQDLTIGIADANRTDNTVGSIGFFLNLLALRFRRQPNQSFKDAIAEARGTTYAALAHSRLPFDVLLNEFRVDRSSSYSPFFQAFFDYRQGAQETHAWGNTQFKFEDIHPGRTSYDITLDITDSATNALIMLRVQKSLYDITAANLLLETYVHFLDTLSADVSVRLQDTPVYSEKQLAKATTIGRGYELVSDWPSTFPHRIDQVVQNNPNKTALVDGIGQDLTYSDMINRIEAIAEALQGAGIGPGSRVLVFQTAASDWVCSMLAIMRIGSIYVPLDLRNPVSRLASVAVDCGPGAILADHTTLDDVPRLDVPSASVINVSSLGLKPSTPVPNCAQANSPAAILYTSGSTGVPKGIIVTHAGLRNEIEGYTKMWELGAERTLQQSAFTFNHSSDQIYTGLVNGGTVYIVPWSKRGDPIEITKIMRENYITYTKATPSEYSLWMQFGGDNLRQATKWSRAFGGGEPLNSTITQQFAKLDLPLLRVYNSYGPTEISISSTKMEVEYRNKGKMEDGRIPCGYSLPNYYTYVVDEQLRPLPAGMPGEICIGGAGVAVGYLNKELTRQHFITNPFATPEDVSQGWTRMYRTGDIGHLQDDGAMVFHSRMAGDTQIKIRGIRIELSDIESNIISTAGGALKEAVVTLREGNPDFLVAHVVFRQGHEVTDQEAFLQQLLNQLPIPQYMIPVLAIPLETLPLTNHSKVDRKALKCLPLPRRTGGSPTNEELTGTMMQLKEIWQDVLGNSGSSFEIAPSTNFFRVGGNSLLVIRLQQYIRQGFNVVIRLVELLGASTLGEMAHKIEESMQIELIDWEEETRPPSIPDSLKDVSGVATNQQKPKTILVTGATGYIAKYLLPQLCANQDIETIYCVAVRDKQSQAVNNILHSSKIVSYEGDLTTPQLGLSDEDFRSLSSNVDTIIHMGALRSFWDNYHALRPTNVHPTRELVKLATPRQIPIHYISTVGVLSPDAGTDAVSAASCIPATDGTNGYIASRWASEQILERSASTLGVPSSIYRFLPSAQVSSPQDVLEEFSRFVDISGIMPEMDGWEGRFDLVPAPQIASRLSDSVCAQIPGGPTRFSHYESKIAIDVDVLREYLEKEKCGQGLERMAGLKWIGRIKTLGFGYVLTSQEITVGGTHQSRR